MLKVWGFYTLFYIYSHQIAFMLSTTEDVFNNNVEFYRLMRTNSSREILN